MPNLEISVVPYVTPNARGGFTGSIKIFEAGRYLWSECVRTNRRTPCAALADAAHVAQLYEREARGEGGALLKQSPNVYRVLTMWGGIIYIRRADWRDSRLEVLPRCRSDSSTVRSTIQRRAIVRILFTPEQLEDGPAIVA